MTLENSFTYPKSEMDLYHTFGVRSQAASKAYRLRLAPFVNLPERKRTQWALTRDQMRECAWLRPEMVAQIEFTEWTPDGHLRQAKFCGLRDDKKAIEVVREL